MDAKDIIAFIQTVGFPIFIAAWFLLRTEKILVASTDALDRLASIEAQEIELLRVLLVRMGMPTERIDHILEKEKDK